MALPIPRPLHGVLDYIYGAAIVAAPHVLGFTEVASARWAAYALGGTILVASLLTRYELGLFRVIPFKGHIALDYVGGLASLAAPWLLGFSGETTPRNAFVGAGLVALVVASLTQRDEMPAGRVVASSGD